MRIRVLLALLAFLTTCAAARAETASRESFRQKMNENSLVLVCGSLGAPYIQLGHDISVVVNDADNLRVLPVVSDGAFTNVRDVLYLRGVDLGITTVQTLNALKTSGEYGPNIDRLLTYIAPLSVDTLHVLARPGINSIYDLKGKKVSFNSKGSGTARFTPAVFKALGIPVEEVTMAQGDAIQAMRDGTLDATTCSCPMPLPAFPNVRPEWGFKFLDVPYGPQFERDYFPATITNENYPNLVAKDRKVETLATSTILISFNWPRNTDRYRRTEKFVDAFFTKYEELRKPPRHPAWRDVNFAATIRGWQRFPAAQEWIERNVKKTAEPAPAATTARTIQLNESDEALFREFMRRRQKKQQ
jgi:TRAP transporter TAXI family solute receptor